MSRIVVKNLPRKISVNKLREIFSAKGHITDLQPKYKKNGVFRQFAFIGYKTEEEAQAAKDYFHNTFIQTSKVKVEICQSLGDADKVKSWSKDSKEKPVKKLPNCESQNQIVENENIEQLEKDSQFAEFMKVSGGKRKSKPLWCDDAIEFENDGNVQKSDENGDSSDCEEKGDNSDENNVPPGRHISDMQYLRSKIQASANSSKDKSLLQEKKAKAFQEKYTVKLRKLPHSCKRKHLKAFFLPLKPVSIRLPPKAKGFAYAGFATEKDMKKALNKHRGFLDGHRVDVVLYQKKEENIPQETAEKDEESQKEEALELIAETGRLFVRNLCYSVTEEELQEVFSKIGPIAEILIPKDFYTKQGLGFAFVSYVFAEHAVKAFTELDGTIFQGRLLHVIPGKPKNETIVDPEDMTFKEKKASKIKSLSQSSHNWNTLFLGQNAVADAMVEKYGISKSDLLSDNTKESVVTRMALGETELVMQTRAFLLRHGVKLDSFSQAAAARSTTVIIVKNLPVKTTTEQLTAVFARYGDVNRAILPSPGITALVEFKDSTEAKTAFSRLAYSRFVNKPLYLEWAPLDVFTAEPVEENMDKVQDEDSQIGELEKEADESGDVKEENVEEEEEDAENYAPPEGTTLFVKNLNFDTSEESLRKHFAGCGPLHSVSISKKKDMKSGKLLSMGFGFVQYKKKSSAVTAMQDLQLSNLDGHTLELKYSKRATLPVATMKRKKSKMAEQKTSKICVRNIPFEATEKEIKELFENFGDIKGVRLPKKDLVSHRGFGFVDFVHKRCAKKAFEALCHNTHLLGRRLVLEWANPESEDVTELRKKTSREFDQRGPERRVKKSKLQEDVIMAKRADE